MKQHWTWTLTKIGDLHDGNLSLVDVGAGKRFQCKPTFDVCPTLTRTRAKQRGFYLTKKNRALSPKDSLASSSQVSFVVNSFLTAYVASCAKFSQVFTTVSESQECLRLQGLPTMLHAAALEAGMSDTHLMGAAGNAWPVSVVSKIVRQIGKSMSW